MRSELLPETSTQSRFTAGRIEGKGLKFGGLMSTSFPIISLSEARRIALRSQGLAEDDAPFGFGQTAALKAVQHLGYVQIDTISVVERAHHHVLWSRIPDYEPAMLHALHEKERAVFEYWNHAASYLPTVDYRFSLPLRKIFRRKEYWSENSPDMERAKRRLLGRIRRDGSLLLREVESKKLIESWWNAPPSKIEKRALHRLWLQGKVMIRSRQGFQKVFDLPERVVPQNVDQTIPSASEAAEFHVRKALLALGVARVSELHYLQEAERAEKVKGALRRLIKTGEVIELRVAEFPEAPCYAFKEALSLSAPLNRRRIRILSPFDNLVIQRQRLRWLFNFDYVIECYVPAPKRRFGYFVLPILWGEEFIGRMDAKADRPAKKLLIQNLFFESSFKPDVAFQREWQRSLSEFMRFQKCDAIEFKKVTPSSMKRFIN